MIGFGVTQFLQKEDTVCLLREANIMILSKDACMNNAFNWLFGKNDTICAGDTNGGVDACQVL